jgi:Flp pilus assembly protein TadD
MGMMLSTLEYQLLGEKKFKEVIAICKLNAEVYPNEWTTYDELGDAYMANGDKVLAIEAYRKSLALFPGNMNATEQIRKLKSTLAACWRHLY